MNMHVPQSLQTAVELKYLAAVSKHIISPSSNEPIIGPAQDNLVGLFKITDDNVFFTQQEVMNMLVGVEKFNGEIPEPAFVEGKVPKWTGKQIYSVILPPITFYNAISKKNPLLKDVIIEAGILKQGQIEKKSSVSILHQICNDYGNREATRYLNDLQRIVTRYMIRSGFSVGISDLLVDKEIRKRNEEAILQGKKDIVELTKKVHLNILEDISDGLDVLYEKRVQGVNSKVVKSIVKNTTNTLTLDNRINYIVTSGSKGSDLNIQQMMCLLGEQAIDGKRVPLGFTDRTLPHYPRYENGAESRGFISSNFTNGLNPHEFFFHAMAGREGVIDTAVKTANSGYLQRKLVKSMEDLKVAHDSSVRSSNNDIVQFCYGYDGFNSADLEKQTSRFIKINIDTLNKNYYFDTTDKYEYVMKTEIDKMKKIENWKQIMLDHNKKLEGLIEQFHNIYTKFNKIDDVLLYYPVNFNRLIMNTTKLFKLDDVNKSDIHPLEMLEEIQKLIDYCKVNDNRSITSELLMWDYLSPKILLRDKKFNRMAFMHVINSIKARFKATLAEGGEMVGPLAAQSLGEKTTQMTLHTFHSSGVAEKSAVTQGVPRLNELLMNTKNPKNNSCEIFLDDEHRFNREMVEKVVNNIELTTIGDVLASTAIYLEPNNDYDKVLAEDREFMEIYKVFSEMDSRATQIPENPWVIRLEFDRRKIIDKKITMEDINRILSINMPKASLMYMDDNAAKLVFRLRLDFQASPNKANDDILFLEEQIKTISDIVIKGVDGITKVYMSDDPQFMNQIIVKENGSFVSKQEFTLNTDGTSLFDILTRKGVDSNRTFSIDPNEMYAIFGIEAARFQILYQLMQVLAASSISLSPRHLDLLCDKMCQNGDIMAISRHGLKKENIGPLAKASFEETTDQFLEASLFGAFDNIKGVSSNIMVGQIPICGTGDSTVMLDEEMLNTQEDVKEEEKVDINKYFESSEYCEAGDIKFSLGDIKAAEGEFDDYPDVMVN